MTTIGTCQSCGSTISWEGRRPRKRCEPCFRRKESQRTKAYWEANPEKARENARQRHCKVNYGHCHICSRVIARNKPVTDVSTCGTLECKRRYNANRMKALADKHRAQGRDVYAPYRAAARARHRERVESGELLPKRQRYPEQYKEYDQRRRAREAGVECERFTTLEICQRDRWTCGICGQGVEKGLRYPNPESPSLDHVIPLSKGGTHTRANVRCSHLRCNVARGNRLDAA